MTLPAEEDVSRNAVKPFIGHLEDLRMTLIRSLAALAVAMLAAIPLAPSIMDLLKWPLIKAGQDPKTFIKTFEVTGGFSISMQLMFWSALVMSAPFIVFFVGEFVFPGLTSRERKAIIRSSGFVVGLFFGGVCMGYFAILPVALKVMFGISDWVGVPTGPIMITSYVTFCLQLLLGFGLAFELPAILVLLGYLGIISSKQLRAKRALAVVIILIAAMLLTPGPDVFSQLLMAVPLILLFEISILILRLHERRKAADNSEAPQENEEER